jgi:single-strand DNA-binding protein
MASDNCVTLVGNLAEDPELRKTSAEVPVTGVRIAVNQRFFDKQADAWDDRLDGFFTCNVWRAQAQHVAASLRKGDRVLVTGRLRSRSYVDKDGATRWVTEIEAEEVCPTLRFAEARPVRAAPQGRPDDVPPVDDLPGAPGTAAIAADQAPQGAEDALEPTPF